MAGGRKRALGAFGGGALVGAGVSRSDLVEKMVDAFVRVLDKHGPLVAITTLFVVSTLVLCWRLLDVALRSKDDEIKRLAKLRDELWKQHVQTLPQSGYTDSPPKRAPRKPSMRRGNRNDG